MKKINKIIKVKKEILLMLFAFSTIVCFSQQGAKDKFLPGDTWMDQNGEVINAHGGGILYDQNKYYWFGEKRGQKASEGVNVYSSVDLYNWKFEGLALAPNYTDTTNDIAVGCLMERPKVIYNPATKKYVMWFHLELKGKGYSAARAAVAISDKVTGPYRFVHSFRPNGNMSRDMTLFVDKDGSAYHVYSSRENHDLRITKLTDDFLNATREDTLLFSNLREAPALFCYQDKYFLITSGCTGWAPNKASLHTASSLWGPWTAIPGNPMKGEGEDLTFGGQSTYIMPLAGKKDAFIFMADKWNSRNLKDSRYLWLPVQFHDGLPVVEWTNQWDLQIFNKANDGYTLVWADEFNNNGRPDSTNWNYEKGFVRNEELQWYQPENARIENGLLVIEAIKEEKPNPNFQAQNNNWRINRQTIYYTSACIVTKGKKTWQYGRFEMKARIDISKGMWPAWWTLGIEKRWPANGEIDIMEYYRGKLLANVACLGKDRKAEWYSNKFSTDSLGGTSWAEKFHVWRMDWTEEYIALYIDDQLLNKVNLDQLANKDDSGFNPFKQPHYMLLNLALGGQAGGDPSQTIFPQRFEVDYVRVYQKSK